MRLTQEYENNEPFEGNRSNQYFGLALFLEREFFHTTSDTKFGKKRPDPRIFLFKRSMQEDLRRRIMHAAGVHRVGFDDAQREWLWIIAKTTEAATKFISKRTPMGKSKDHPLSMKKHGGDVIEAFKYALRVAGGYVVEREQIKETWSTDPTLFFDDSDSVWIYVRHDHPLGDLYKIGKTTRRGKRDSAYATHSAESREIAAYPESEYLTEKKIHAHFARKRVKREFFRLSPEDVLTVTDPRKMRAALHADDAG